MNIAQLPTPADALANDDVHRGQVRMAYRLADQHTNRLLHVHGIGWHAWDGRRWTEDTTGAAKRAVIDVLKRALANSLGDREIREDVRKCESAASIAGVLSIAAALEPFAATVDCLDADPYLLNTAAGTLDLRTMDLHPHNPTDRITKVTNAAVDPTAAGSAWHAFLARSLPDEGTRGFLQRYVGSALLGSVREHVLAILTGDGANGKGTFYGAVNYALGDYAQTGESDLFMHRDGAHPTGEMDLMGSRWVVVSESDEGRRLAAATVKRLTGGDKIKARRMRQDFVEFDPSHTACLVTNHLPKVKGDDLALWRRLRVVPFNVIIPEGERDAQLGDKLRAEADAVLTWALAGWVDYGDHGLSEPESVLAATGRYHADSDALGRFIDSECIVSPVARAKASDLWEAWCRWRAEDGCEEISKKAFGDALDRRGYDSARGTGGVRMRHGLGLYSTEDEPS